MGSIIVIPPSVLMDQIFRKARPKSSKTDTLIRRMEERQDHLEEKIRARENDEEAGGGGENDKEEDVESVEDAYYTSSEIGKLL